jgi:hypothetical protein
MPAGGPLEGQLRECFGRVVYTHKTHEKCSDILLERLDKIKTLQIVLSAITTGGIISTVFGDGQIGTILAVIASTLLLALNTYTKSYDLGEVAQKHKQAAIDIWLIREKYLSLITDLRLGDRSTEEIIRSRDDLLDELHNIYSGAPTTTSKAYRRAQKALQTADDITFSDDEIDSFLPTDLRRNS